MMLNFYSRKKTVVVVALVVAVLVISFVVFMALINKYRFNFTVSFPKGIYQVKPAEEAGCGDLVTFCLESNNPFSRLAKERQYIGYGSCPSGLKPLLKRLTGLPGDFVEVTRTGIILNGLKLPGSARPNSDSQGRDLPPALLIGGVIPEGQVMVLSQTHDDSFDSRHFGLIQRDLLLKVEPILILTDFLTKGDK